MESLPASQPATSPIDWNEALQAHARWIRSVVLARVGEPQAVDEVFQEVALAAVRQQAPLTDAAKVGPWLYRLAVTQSLLFRRRQGRRRKLVDRYADRTAADDGPVAADPLEWLIAAERGETVRRALAQLARRDREILLLKYTEDWSYRELASHLGLSESAVEARLHRARRKLRGLLAE